MLTAIVLAAIVLDAADRKRAESKGQRPHPEKEQEQVAVAFADGVANPGAEVVERLYAAVCHRAVFRAERPHDLAADAQLAPVTGPERRGIQLPATTHSIEWASTTALANALQPAGAKVEHCHVML